MTTFRYKGQTAGGAKVSGVLRAYDEFEAADKLRESVAIITKLEAVPEKKESVLSRPVAFRVKEKELALLCSQFAIILASGLSVERCVSMVAAQTKNKYLRRMLDKVSEEVGAGYSLAQMWGDRIFEKCGIRRDEGGDGGKTLEIRGKRRLSARDGGANYQQS